MTKRASEIYNRVKAAGSTGINANEYSSSRAIVEIASMMNWGLIKMEDGMLKLCEKELA